MNEFSILYRAVFTGVIDSSVDKTDLKQKLQNRYQLTGTVLNLFFQNKPLVIESNLSYTDAQKIFDELQHWGMEIKLVALSDDRQNFQENSQDINHLISRNKQKNLDQKIIKKPRIFSFDFTGRYDRTHFLSNITIQALFSVPLFLFAIATPDHELIDAIYAILLITWGFWTIRTIVLRLHDFDQNNTGIQIIAAIPILGAVFGLFFLTILFYLPLLWKKGCVEKNRFGLPLPPLSLTKNMIAISYYLLTLLMMLIFMFYLVDQSY